LRIVLQELEPSVLEHISLEVGVESNLVLLEGGVNSLSPRLTAARLGTTKLVATASYNGYQVL
jgi:hypothetical protein